MYETIGAFEAKTHFSDLLSQAEQGFAVTVTRRGKPVARIVPFEQKPDTTKARAAFAAIMDMKKQTSQRPFDWEEWKSYRDEGRDREGNPQ